MQLCNTTLKLLVESMLICTFGSFGFLLHENSSLGREAVSLSPVAHSFPRLLFAVRLVSNVFGFPDYESLLTLHDNGTVRFYAGMVSKGLGAWSVIEGDPEEGEDPSDLFIVSRLQLGCLCFGKGSSMVNHGQPWSTTPLAICKEWTQPLTDAYKDAFIVPGGTAFWRGKLNFKTTKSKHLASRAEQS